MFVMETEPKFENEAKGKMPGDQGEPFSFRARFVALGETEQKTFNLNTEEGTVDFLKRTFVGMTDVLDANEQQIPFNEVTRDWLIDRAHSRAALVQSYFSGVYGAVLGN